MSNIIDKIQVSGVTYDIGGTGGGGNPTVELTQAEYDALVSAGTVSADTYYIITDSQAGDLTNYYTKTEVDTALSRKQATLVSGTNIKTINNESILGSGNIDIQGGGKEVSGGTNISITTGETADTINCTLPISVDTKQYGTNLIFFDLQNTFNHNRTIRNFIVGYNNTFGNIYDQAEKNIVFGDNNNLEGNYQGRRCVNNFVVGNGNFFGSMSAGYAVSDTAVFGQYNKPKNNYEYVFGQYNNSVSASTTFGDGGNTLFSVGNGTSESARHNAFEIRQNGDIYLSSGGTDIKLQDHLGGGGGSSYTAGDGIDITNDVISVTGKVDTSAFTAHTADTVIHVTSAEKANWNAKSDFSGSYNDLTNKPTIPTSASQLTNDTGYITSSALDGYATTATTSALNNTLTAHTADTNVHTSAPQKTLWNNAAVNASNAITALGGLSLVKLSQSEYDALATKDSNTLYVIVN